MIDDSEVIAAARAQREILTNLCSRRLKGHRLYIASNRGPLEFREVGHRIETLRGQGGLVTGLKGMAAAVNTTWIASAMSEVETEIAHKSDFIPVKTGDDALLDFGFVTPTAVEYHHYYDLVSNAVLWFLQHNISNPPLLPNFDVELWNAWTNGYVSVNRQFANKLVDAASCTDTTPIFLIQDYHLYLVPRYLREKIPNALIEHFTHIAWPGPESWLQLPPAIREAILLSLLSCNVVGFHCERFVRNFLETCHVWLKIPVNWNDRTIEHQGRVVQVDAFPISIDPIELRTIAQSDYVQREERKIVNRRPAHLILQVARTDPSKNIIRSFQAFAHFLELNPHYIERVVFIGLLPASRQSSDLYKTYFEELQSIAAAVNTKFGRPGWQPIELHFENDYERGIAAMKQYDVLIVNSIADGMNLVAKEGPIVNERGGVLVLSESAGATDELGSSALVVNPFDIVGMARTLLKALEMSVTSREKILNDQRRKIGKNTIFRWASTQLEKLISGVPENTAHELNTACRVELKGESPDHGSSETTVVHVTKKYQDGIVFYTNGLGL